MELLEVAGRMLDQMTELNGKQLHRRCVRALHVGCGTQMCRDVQRLEVRIALHYAYNAAADLMANHI